MRNKVARISLAFVVLFAATFSAAPMAFCFVNAESPVAPSCCPTPHKNIPHSESNRSDCPICKFNYCKLDPNPVLKTTPTSQLLLHSAAPIAGTLVAVETDVAPNTHTVHFFDSSPPLYLRVCTFRI